MRRTRSSYLRERTEPQGFKAQFVAVDREACALYADALVAAGLRPEEIAVIFTPNLKKDDASLRRWYAAEQLRRRGNGSTGGGDVELDEDSELDVAEAAARKQLIADFKDPENPLKLLIVTDMLLTGFDAPVEQVMFLDKPLRGAKLLQAIMRTNRPFPERQKDRGIIIDYWGVFERLQEAFAEFDPDEVDLAVVNMRELREHFPVQLAEATRSARRPARRQGRVRADDVARLLPGRRPASLPSCSRSASRPPNPPTSR